MNHEKYRRKHSQINQISELNNPQGVDILLNKPNQVKSNQTKQFTLYSI